MKSLFQYLLIEKVIPSLVYIEQDPTLNLRCVKLNLQKSEKTKTIIIERPENRGLTTIKRFLTTF